jgi:hypothetical protein
MQRRVCRVATLPVTAVDPWRIRAWVWVEAESALEAALLGYVQLSQDEWLEEGCSAAVLVVEPWPPVHGAGYEVRLSTVLRFLDREGGKPAEIIRRNRMRAEADRIGLRYRGTIK